MTQLRAEVELFMAAAAWVEKLVDMLPGSAWSGPGIGKWDMRALVGHASRALLTAERYSATSASTEEITSPEAYFKQVARQSQVHSTQVFQRGVEAGDALGDDPAAEFGVIVRRVSALMFEINDQLISTIAGGIRLSNYLPTRTFELIVHGLDIAHSAHLPDNAPEAALHRSLELTVGLAMNVGAGQELLMAATGRNGLRPGFSVLD